MGIPKFFRYISERWPMISQLIEGAQIPEFDNLYLDMNSILHTCTHGNDDDVTKRMTEEEVFAKIFTYIDHLFHTIKPKKVFYMAIDGVAPRAKMNQQRSRRFRTAMDAEAALKKAIEKGEEIPKGEPFDSNAITPGTEFMAKLTKNLKYFIHDKISNDSKWREVDVIFSGHEVPGEGEHKIMDFIRNIRSQKDYNNNTRHCIYGLDADLIMLGLSTHAPHFALLREEVVFGRRSSKPAPLEHQNFYLLHLSLLREYMELEFNEIADDLKFDYDFERILDDFILVMFVIGNDFLPNLPDLHLNKGAFPVLLQTFKEALLHLDGYINENGQINLERLRVWLNYLSQFELMNFEKNDIDVEWFNQQLENISLEGERKRARSGKKLLLKQQKKIVGKVKPWIMHLANEKFPSDLPDDQIPTLLLNDDKSEFNVAENLAFLKEFAHDLGVFIVHSKSKDTYSLKLDIDGINPSETDEEHNERVGAIRRVIKRYQQAVLVEDAEELEREQTLYNEKFQNWKQEYYKDKLGFAQNDSETVTTLAKNYVEGLQWVLYYYYRGCPSWGWYYRDHYAPRISDLEKGLDQIIKFDKGRPFTPFEQLMAVLPERSKNLIPAAFRPLMYDTNSPILDFYPSQVKLDKNGKTADWEAVVLLTFVDENRLVDAMKPLLSKLSPEEKVRNQFGTDLKFIFSPQVDNLYKSPLSGIFSDLENNHCVEREYIPKSMDGLSFHYGLLPGAKQGTELLAGFPTLQTLPFKYQLEYNESLVFQQASRQQSMCLHIEDIYSENNLTLEELSKRYMNKIVYTRWPYLRESKLVSVFDENVLFEGKEFVNEKGKKHFKIIERTCDIQDKKNFESLKRSMLRNYGKQKAVILNDIKAIVKVLPVTGLMRTPEGAYVKTYAETPDHYPLQLMVETISNKDERYRERAPVPISQEFPEGSRVIFLGDYAYGGDTTIDGYSSESRLKITVKKTFSKNEPTIGKERLEIDNKLVHYIPSYVAAKKLDLNKLFLSRITSKFLIDDANGKHVNVGIPVKYENKQQKVLGYARRNPKGWEYSNLTINLIREYRSRFPEFFRGLSRTGNGIPSLQELFPGISTEVAMKKLQEIKDWLKFSEENFVIVSNESDSLTKGSIRAVEDFIEVHSSGRENSETKQLTKVPRDAILNPRVSFGLLRTQRFNLGDRVVYIQDSGKVPLFSKGTVVGYTTLGLSLSVQVLFDHEIVSGNTFGGRLRTKRGLGLDSSFLLNVTDRQFVYHSKASKKLLEGKKSGTKSVAARNVNMIQRKQKQQEVATMRKQAAHDLLNIIKKTGEKPADGGQKEPAATQERETLLKKSGGENADANLPLPNQNVVNSVVNAVMHQFDSNDNQMVSNGQQNVVPTMNNGVVNPASLPYSAPPGFVNGVPLGAGYPPNMQMSPQVMNGQPLLPPQSFYAGPMQHPQQHHQQHSHAHPHPQLPHQNGHVVVNKKASAELKQIFKSDAEQNKSQRPKKTILKRRAETKASAEPKK
ncbi:hypothetical protein KAFR_0C03080 [Kazachstania africana CBS 2517]|uniref:5'-3' exoribonuclease 1 n=1 Tax=Kazachstania africana (strain ATCC 22294 / BCRC 22015 / CBS 2517 / CECT 1963 / NBRC 1671 / NRRL Y-8276) TaxID=1071382 RepID=H2ASF0_KAZAF|nr:hypothetical protein KAFR_0C03080 [Kazachstania africana CBS 2517]CCF57300.1 hypothetical protein KAFR_0C03080 [Kazachstania africana CBS 2517]